MTTCPRNTEIKIRLNEIEVRDTVEGLNFGTLKDDPSLRALIVHGRLPQGENEILIKEDLIRTFGIEASAVLDREVTLTPVADTFNEEAREIAGHQRLLRVVGVLRSSLVSNINQNLVSLDEIEDIHREHVSIGGSADDQGRIQIIAHSSEDVATITTRIKSMKLAASSANDMINAFRAVFRTINFILASFGAIALVTALFGIANTMVISVLERRRQIGTLKTLGARDSDVLLFFLGEAAGIGLVGATLGLILGFLSGQLFAFSLNTIFHTRLPEGIGLHPYISGYLILTSITGAILVSVLAGYFPARRAAKLDPIRALRDE